MFVTRELEYIDAYETKDLVLKTFIDFISFPTLIYKLNYRDLDTESKVLYS